MRAPLALIAVAVAAAPAWADKKLDPDPAFLPKARSAVTATVEAHYDLVSDKVPFWARFLICAGQLTAARDEGRALPIPKDGIEKLIADYRGRAVELAAYRRTADAKAPALEVDAEIAKVRAGAMQFLPADTTKLGVEHMKKLHGNRLAFCQLTRDWYEVQNGLRTATAPADQQKFAKQEAEQRARDKAASAPRRCRPRSNPLWCSRRCARRARPRSRRSRPRRSSCPTLARPSAGSTCATSASGWRRREGPWLSRRLFPATSVCARSGPRSPNASRAWN